MKKAMLAVAAIGTSLVAMPAMAEAQQRTIVKERGNRTVVIERGGGVRERTVLNRRGNVVRQNVRVSRPSYHYGSWQRGQRFNRAYAPNYRAIDYRAYRGRGLYAPPRGHQWVQSGNDAALVALASGLIGAVVGGAIF